MGNYKRCNSMIQLSRNTSAFFNINIESDAYYTFKIKYGDLGENCLPRLECLIDNRVIGTTYFSKDNLPLVSSTKKSIRVETLGTQIISKGLHRLETRAMFEPTECVDYVEIKPIDRKVEEALFSFVVISDTHIHDVNSSPVFSEELYTERGAINTSIPLYGRDGIWEYPFNWINRMVYYKMSEIMEKVVKDINRLNPNLVIHTGDLSGEKKEYLITAKSFLDKLNCPYYIARGNHDQSNEMVKVFGIMENSNYSFGYGSFHFIILDLHPLKKNGKGLGWLRQDLDENRNKRIFIFIHAPFVMSDNLPINIITGKPYDMRIGNSEKVLNLLDRYENIKAVFSGHSHINTTIERNGVYHFQTPALVEYPMLYRQVVVFSSHIEVRSYQLPKSFLKESFLTTPDNIFNDANNGWVIGKNSDLYREIDLKK